MTKLVVLDRDPYAAAALGSLLDRKDGIRVVGYTSDATEALEIAEERQPDVVVMELSLYGISGIEVMQLLLGRSPASRIIIFTDGVPTQDLIAALALEPRGFLLKRGCGTDTLLETIGKVADGETVIPTDTLLSAVRNLTTTVLSERAVAGYRGTLSRREMQVLRLMAKGTTNKEIGHMLSISQGTVKTHAYRIFQKLDVRDRTEAVTTALQLGIFVLDRLDGPALDGHERQPTPLSG